MYSCESWEHFTEESLVSNKYYRMLTKIMVGIVKTTYGSLLLVIDQYRQKSKSMYMIMLGGKKTSTSTAIVRSATNVKPIDGAFSLYKLIR
jgi:hypothetical protein